MAANSDQNSGLPLQNTGVPAPLAQSQVPGQPPQFEPLAPPVRPMENPNDGSAIASAIGGLLLNIAGAGAGKGAVGNEAVAMSQNLQQQGRVRNEEKTKAATDAFTKKKAAAESEAILPYLDKMENPQLRDAAKVALQYGDTAKAEKLISQDRSDAQYKLSVNRYNNSLFNTEVGNERRAVGDMVSSAKDAAQTLQKSLPAEVGKAVEIEKTLTKLKKVPESPGELQVLFNAKSTGFKLSKEEAKQLFSEVKDSANAIAPNSTVLGLPIPLTSDRSAVKPSEAFKDYAAKKFDADTIADYIQKKQSVEDYHTHAEQLKLIESNLTNPKARPQALQVLRGMQQKALQATGGQRPQAPAPQAPAGKSTKKDAPPKEERLYSPSANKYFIKKADGSIVPE